jgi:hypothetical protein
MRRDPFKTLFASFRTERAVEDPVASDVWTYTDGKGRTRKARVAVGKPQKIPNDPSGDWFCPVYVEGFTPHVTPAIGVGPLDSLMNAITVVKGFQDYVGTMHFIRERTPRGRTRRAVTRPK